MTGMTTQANPTGPYPHIIAVLTFMALSLEECNRRRCLLPPPGLSIASFKGGMRSSLFEADEALAGKVISMEGITDQQAAVLERAGEVSGKHDRDTARCEQRDRTGNDCSEHRAAKEN